MNMLEFNKELFKLKTKISELYNAEVNLNYANEKLLVKILSDEGEEIELFLIPDLAGRLLEAEVRISTSNKELKEINMINCFVESVSEVFNCFSAVDLKFHSSFDYKQAKLFLDSYLEQDSEKFYKVNEEEYLFACDEKAEKTIKLMKVIEKNGFYNGNFHHEELKQIAAKFEIVPCFKNESVVFVEKYKVRKKLDDYKEYAFFEVENNEEIKELYEYLKDIKEKLKELNGKFQEMKGAHASTFNITLSKTGMKLEMDFFVNLISRILEGDDYDFLTLEEQFKLKFDSVEKERNFEKNVKKTLSKILEAFQDEEIKKYFKINDERILQDFIFLGRYVTYLNFKKIKLRKEISFGFKIDKKFIEEITSEECDLSNITIKYQFENGEKENKLYEAVEEIKANTKKIIHENRLLELMKGE